MRSIAALTRFLDRDVWLYVAWLILLIGAALLALVDIARRHVTGQPPARLRDIAAAIGAPASILEALADDFVRRGILLRSVEPEGIARDRAGWGALHGVTLRSLVETASLPEVDVSLASTRP